MQGSCIERWNCWSLSGGVLSNVALGIVSEVCTDITQFATHKNLSTRKITHLNRYLNTTHVKVARVASRSEASALLAVNYQKIASLRDQEKATLAIAHKILIAAFHVLRDMGHHQLDSQDIKILEIEGLRELRCYRDY